MRAAVTASLMAVLAMPASADDATAQPGLQHDASKRQTDMDDSAGIAAAGRSSATRLPDERDDPLRLLALVGPAVVIFVLTVLGLTITFRELGHDRRDRRIVYRPRGHKSHGSVV